MIHPASRDSQAWGGVLGRLVVVIVVLIFVIIIYFGGWLSVDAGLSCHHLCEVLELFLVAAGLWCSSLSSSSSTLCALGGLVWRGTFIKGVGCSPALHGSSGTPFHLLSPVVDEQKPHIPFG